MRSFLYYLLFFVQVS